VISKRSPVVEQLAPQKRSGYKEAKTIYIFSTNQQINKSTAVDARKPKPSIFSQQINKSTLLCRLFGEGEYVKGECDGGEVVTGDL